MIRWAIARGRPLSDTPGFNEPADDEQKYNNVLWILPENEHICDGWMHEKFMKFVYSDFAGENKQNRSLFGWLGDANTNCPPELPTIFLKDNVKWKRKVKGILFSVDGQTGVDWCSLILIWRRSQKSMNSRR